MASLRTDGPYVWVTWLPRLISGESSCEWASWFKAQHEGWSWSRMPSDFDQTGWLLNHTALLNEQRERWEQQGYSVLTEGQNSFNLRGSSAVLAGKPDMVARRRDQITVIDAKTGRPSPAHTAQVLIYMYALPRALERYKGLSIAGQWPTPTTWSTYRPMQSTGGSSRTWAASSAAWRRSCRPGGCPALGSAGSVRSPRPTAPRGLTTVLRRRAQPATSEGHQTHGSGGA